MNSLTKHPKRKEYEPLLRDIHRLEKGLLPTGFSPDDTEDMGQINTTAIVVDDDTRFLVKINVSPFKPEEIDVRIDGEYLTIKGRHEWKDSQNYIKRSFFRKWSISPDVDVHGFRSNLSPNGRLSVQAPKISLHLQKH